MRLPSTSRQWSLRSDLIRVWLEYRGVVVWEVLGDMM
jgi:hypothetical protein